MTDPKEIFGEPISVYTSEQAIEDGVLVAINKKDLATRNVFEWLGEVAPTGAPPDRWPVPIMTWFKSAPMTQEDALKLIAKQGQDAQAVYERALRDRRAVALAGGLIDAKGSTARRIYENNEGGGIWSGWAVVDNGKLVAFKENSGSKKLWMIPNEIGGLTLMFPEDY